MKSDDVLHEEIKVTFCFVGGNVNPGVITAKTDIQPSEAHAKGETVEKHPERTHPTGFWGLNSSLPPNRSLEEHLKDLLNTLEPRSSIIKEFRDIGLNPTFYCGCFTAGTTTSIKLEANTLQRIADIGASLEYHLYCCDEDD